MGCGRRVKASEIRADQKWDFISLGDFKSTNCFGGFAYAYLLGSLLVSIAVYGVDTFTAVNLLVFDKWSGKIEPKIELKYSKWIFSACIIASWVNLGYEYVRALRVIKRGAVAESYLDSLAVRLQCIRWTKMGRGWRRFLVFAELTKSKKGAEYVALFTYFSFQSWIRIIFCQGPRQVVNAVTLYAVLQSQLIPTEGGDVGSVLGQFFKKIGVLAEEDNQQAVILSGMLFTLVIWVFGALSLILGCLFYVFFLWHYIPNGDGGLGNHCELKINKRLAAIVSVKVNKAIEEEERKRVRADAKALKKGEKPQFGRQATLPTLFNAKESPESDKLPPMPMLNRNDTMTTLPQYESRPGTPNGKPSVAVFELDQLDNKRPAPGRSITGTSFGSNAPLISNASDMGYGSEPVPSLPLPQGRNGYPAPIRTMTGSSQNSQWNNNPRMQGDGNYTASPVSYDSRPLPSHMSSMSNTSQGSFDNYGRPINPPNERSFTPAGPAPSMGRRTPFDESSPIGRNSPAPFAADYDADYPMQQPIPQRGPTSDYGRNSPAPGGNGRFPVVPSNEYQAFDPTTRSASAAPTPYPASSTPGPAFQERNVTGPMRGPPQDYFRNSRPGTAQSGRQPPPSQGRNITEPVRGPPRDYFGNERPGTAQSSRQQTPGPQQNRNIAEPMRGPPQDFYGNERPGTAQGGRQQTPGPQQNRSEPTRVPPQDFYGNERPGTAQSGRQPPNVGRMASPSPYNGGGGPPPGGFDSQGYRR